MTILTCRTTNSINPHSLACSRGPRNPAKLHPREASKESTQGAAISMMPCTKKIIVIKIITNNGQFHPVQLPDVIARTAVRCHKNDTMHGSELPNHPSGKVVGRQEAKGHSEDDHHHGGDLLPGQLQHLQGARTEAHFKRHSTERIHSGELHGRSRGKPLGLADLPRGRK